MNATRDHVHSIPDEEIWGHKGEKTGSPRGHATGNAADFSCRVNPSMCSNRRKAFCCAAQCGFEWGQYERKGVKGSTGNHIHIQKERQPGAGSGQLPPRCVSNCEFMQ